jgi:mannose-6-phosphate isomerase-like protein (cupin superfamily)
MKSKTILKINIAVVILISVFSLGFYSATKSIETIPSQIFRRGEAKAVINDWGKMDIYTSGHTNTYGTEGMFTALADVLPGQSAHPAHRHGEEEFLVITRGTGVWSLKGQEVEARTGDVLYVNPWDFHGLVNTGQDTLTFFVIKWKNKLIDMPAEPEGSHGR